jgi:hypothetical protein
MKKSKCCDATIDASLGDGILMGSCSKWGKTVARINPKTGKEEDLESHNFNPWYDYH